MTSTQPRFRWALCLALCLLGCESYTPEKRSAIYESCCDGAGTCVPTAFVGADQSQVGQDKCEENLMCVPAGLAANPDTYLADTCRSFGLAEGRCLPTCLPRVMDQADRLRQDGCPDATLCVPCTDPLTGKDTSACTIGGDQGPVEPPTFFAFCCGERGRCIPQDIVGDDMPASLDVDSCDRATESVCVPQIWVDDRNAKPPVCKSWDDAEGRCLSVCLPDVKAREKQLRADTCDADTRCVPCFDPITGERTPACAVGDDEPTQPAQRYAPCCGDVGACVPLAAVPEENRSQLTVDSCAGAASLCVPREWIQQGEGRPTDCNAYGGAAGRCMPRCLPDVIKQQDRLLQANCEDTHLCVPCYDPIDGTNTGACAINGDTPPTQAYLFDNCCKNRGRCVPSDATPEMSRDDLSSDTCTDTEALCVPSQWLGEAPAAPAKCAPYGDYEGRCLPDCLPAVADKLGRLRQTSCQAGDVCAPCYDPVTGASTHACEINGDVPGPVRTFSGCCGDIGACVPQDALQTDDRERLDPTECAAVGGGLCAPKAWVVDDRVAPATCRAIGGTVEGRCLPACLPDVQKRASQLLPENCQAGELCVPCFDPVDFSNTRACNIGPDAAQERPAGFPECADKQGWCVPQVLVKEADRSRLPTDTCDAAAGKTCAPAEWVRNDRFIPTECVAPGGLEARCLPDFLPAVVGNKANLTISGCPDRHLCVPCTDPVSGVPTDACTINGDQSKTGSPATYPECCGNNGLCVPKELLMSNGGDTSQLGADSCNADQAMCVPRAWVGTQRSAPATCRGYDNAEGRCLPSCLPAVAAQAGNLRQDTCAATDRCVPCFDPIDGSDTGACTQLGDTAKEPAQTFANCCGNLGRCVPTELVSSEERSDLGQDSCAAGDHLCAPNNSIGKSATPAATCHESRLSAEGRCLPNCLPAVAKQAGNVMQDGCATSTSCVPCYDPVSGDDTGACTQGNDTAKEAKKVFENCCGGAARCVPSNLVAEANRGQLGKDSCKNPADALCVPNEWTSETPQPPKSCRAPGNLEARCLLSCLPDVASKKDQLRQTSCGGGELCAPCYDPLTGEDTGSCSINGDSPKEAKKTYDACCGSKGTCVPPEMINGDKSSLNKDSCSGSDLCVPQESARGNTANYNSCTVLFIMNGACVPKCFINSNQDPGLGSSCAGDETCAPCNQLGNLKTTSCN